MTGRWRISLAALLAALFLLAGCAGGAPQPPTVTGFACNVTVSYQGMTIAGRLTRPAAGLLSLSLTSPETLKDMELEWDGTEVKVKLYGLSFGVDPAAFPESALGSSLLGALDAAVRAAPGLTSGGGLTTTGQAVGGEFELISDPVNGQLIALKIPASGLEATFSGFELI